MRVSLFFLLFFFHRLPFISFLLQVIFDIKYIHIFLSSLKIRRRVYTYILDMSKSKHHCYSYYHYPNDENITIAESQTSTQSSSPRLGNDHAEVSRTG